MYSKKELIEMLELDDFEPIFKQVDKCREKNVGNEIQIRALLEFSNFCSRNCSYCGLNCNNKAVTRFRLSSEEIVGLAHEAFAVGYKTIVLQSGEDKYFTTDMLGSIVKQIKKDDIRVTLSCGELSLESYKYLRECGVDRYLLKHETSDEKIYSSLHEGYTIKNRVDCLRAIRQAGIETGSGFMIGLPDQTTSTIADDLLLLKELNCDMAGIGPFIPHPETKLAEQSKGSVELTLRAIALARLLLPKAHLPATTSIGVIDIEKKKSVFNCGANVIMQKITPSNVKRLYEIYPSKMNEMTIEQGRKSIEQEIIALGRIPM